LSFDDLPLFKPSPPRSTEGELLKANGMAAADAAEGSDWKHRADLAIEALAKTGAEFTAVEVREKAGDAARPNAFGARFNAAAGAGLIRKVGCRNSTRPTLHAHPVAVWRGAK